MRKLLLFLSLSFLLFYSCRKEKIQNSDALIEDARSYFESDVATGRAAVQPSGGIKIPLPKMTPQWDRANIQQLKFGRTVVVPLSIPNFTVQDQLQVKFQIEPYSFLIVYDDDEGNKHAEVVIKIPDEYSKTGAFSGIAQVTDWQGNLIQSYKYTYETEQKMSTRVERRKNGPKTETMVLWCVSIDWISCAQVDGYPTFCQYNYTSYYCFTEYSGSPGTGTAPPPGGSCCGSYGSITNNNDSYPLAKELKLIKFDTSIKLINVRTCLNTIFNTLRGEKAGFWGKLIYDFTAEIPGFKWQIREGSLGPNKAATTSADNNGNYTTFNTDYLPNSTNMSVARTMLHEAAHAYLNYLRPTVNKTYPELFQDYVAGMNANAAQHQEIARSFINDIASALKVYGTGLGIQAYDTYYMDIAWGGLQGTTFFNALPEADRVRIQAIYEAELLGQTITLPNGIKVVPLGTRICQ